MDVYESDDDDFDDDFDERLSSSVESEPLNDNEIVEAEKNFMIQKNTYLFFSHQNRTKMYVIDSFNALLANKINTKTRFSNGSILCLTMLKKSSVCHLRLDLLYTGDTSSNKKPKKDWKYRLKNYKYWVKDSEIPDDTQNFTPVVFNSVTTQCNFHQLQDVFKINSDDLKEDELTYCMFNRHGEALHNIKKMNRVYNTSLTEKGERQAYVAGENLSVIMTDLGISKINAISASDLIRTHQTAANFLTGLVEKLPNCLSDIKELFIIPCFHEIEKNTKDGSYSVNRAFSGLGIQNENKTDCDPNKCREINVNGKLIPIYWGFYLGFYGGVFRGSSVIGDKQKHCRDNHFLGLFFDLIHSFDKSISDSQIELGGKKTKRRKSYKKNKTKKRRHNKTKKRRRY
jgi:hypothetical protein